MTDDKELKTPEPGNADNDEILKMLKGGFETEHVLQQRVRAEKADAGQKSDAGD